MDDRNYGSWPVARLKEELRLRGAVVHGKKKDLVERLTAYDKYNNFGGREEAADDEAPMPWTSLPLKYISSQVKCPPMTIDHMWDYFASEGADIHPSALPMYKEGWIISALGVKDGEKMYIQMLVRAEMKKMSRYHVHIVLDKNGNVDHAHCECAAGGGSTAKCKHVATSLYGLESLTRTGKIQMEVTCTQTTQKWHAPRKGLAVSSPAKAANISYKVHKMEDSRQGESAPTGLKLPTSQQATDIPGEQDRLLNLLKNHQATQKTRLNISDCIGGRANLDALVSDHDYLERPLLECFADNMVRVTKAEVADIEQATRGQSSSTRWHQERRIRLTASNFGAVMSMRATTDGRALAKRLVDSRPLSVPAVTWGKNNEGKARRAYEHRTGLKVARCGFKVDIKAPFLGCSPDGVLDDRLLEVKCPYSARQARVQAGVVDWLIGQEGGELRLKEHTRYWYQVQGQMAIMHRSLCDVVVFTEVDMAVVTVHAVAGLYEQVMVPKLRDFYFKYVAPLIVMGRMHGPQVAEHGK